MTIISIIGVLIGLIIVITPVLFNQKSSKVFFYIGAWTIVLSLCTYSFFKEPSQMYDIYRHYELIDYIRNKKWDISYVVFKGISGIDSNYSFCYLYNLWVAIIAKFLPNGILPFMAVLLYYSVFMYIFYHENKGLTISNLEFILSLMLCSTSMPFLYIYSGIRNSSAVALAALGIYRYFKIKKNIVSIIILIGAGVLIHPFAGVAVVVLIFYRFKPKLIWLIFIILFPIILDPLMEWFRLGSGNVFLFKIGAKYYNYTRVRKDNQGLVFYFNSIFNMILWCIVVWIYMFNQRRKARKYYMSLELENVMNIAPIINSNQDIDMDFVSGVWWYTIFSLAFVNSSNIMLRFPFLIGCFSPVFVKICFGNSESNRNLSIVQLILMIGIVCFSGLILYENIVWLI